LKPLLLLSSGEDDADFIYACRFPVERALYIRFGDGDDLLVTSTLELERARSQATAAEIADRLEKGWQEGVDPDAGWAQMATSILRERGMAEVRVSPRLDAASYEALRAAGLQVEIDREVFREERRRKSNEEASFIHSAQRAAEAACSEVVAHLGAAQIRDGLLWLEDRPLTSERLMARAQATLAEIGYTAGEMIIAGSPGSALPHYRGEGQIRAHAPVIMDIFPRGRTSHYHGDLTRTVVVGEVSDDVRRMYDACVVALEAAISEIRAGANGRDVHRATCKVLVDAGFGTSTKGFEGPDGVAKMIHTTGHGVGLDIHEAPGLRDVDYPLVAGDVVTVEPGLYLTGFGGVRVEDSGLVTDEGFKNFTTLTRSIDPADYR
jgi:Xaa-Pro aminopeptidase